MTVNGIILNTLDYFERTRGLGLADTIIKETITYIGETRGLVEEVREYNGKVRKLYFPGKGSE